MSETVSGATGDVETGSPTDSGPPARTAAGRQADVLGGRYRLVRILGHGGMSDVFEATDEESQTLVAVKIVRSAEAGLARRLAQEVRALSMLEHPGLVRLLDTGVADGQAYLVMELVRGSTLAESLYSGPLGPARAADIGTQLARALAYVHGQGIVHRDVKPSNILVGADGGARLGDFGIARLTDASTLTLAGTTLGTAAYMAPEQLEDHQVGPGADVWSLGIVLLECLTGRRVYGGSPGEVVARRLAGPVPLPGNLPVAWRVLLSGMLDHRPEERLNAGDVAALLATSPFRRPWVAADPDPDLLGRMAPPAALDLTALAPGSPATALLAGAMAGSARPPSAPRPTRHNRRWLALLAGLVLAALVVGLVLALGSNPPSTHHHAGASGAADRPHTSTTVAPATTTTTPPTTTSTTAPPTTTLPSSSSALATLLGDVASFQSAGTIDHGSAQAISSQAEQAVTDEGAGKPNQAANDLQQVASVLQTGQQHGKISPSVAASLQQDLAALATALGLSAAGTPPTTAPGPTGPGGPPG